MGPSSTSPRSSRWRTRPNPRSAPLSRPIAVAITGGIGAGKSTALDAFRRHGAATVSSDEIVHHLIRSDADVRRALVERFGDEILDAEGIPDRERIAARVFRDREALDWLEQLLHPLVSREYLEWREQLGKLPNSPRVCVTEVPLLYEVGGEARFDKVVVVTAPAKLREARRGGHKDDREARLLPDREKVKKADFVYVNTGTPEELDAWVAEVMAGLSAETGPSDKVSLG
jgi:dephospho-CoA kinase